MHANNVIWKVMRMPVETILIYYIRSNIETKVSKLILFRLFFTVWFDAQGHLSERG